MGTRPRSKSEREDGFVFREYEGVTARAGETLLEHRQLASERVVVGGPSPVLNRH